jgi:exonuclease SbcD
MKILHTADWHLGHRLLEHSQLEEQVLFLNWLEAYIITQKIDVLLISGDVFDSGSPSNQSLKIYYNFLVKLNATNCKSIIITGGNHDSPGTLNAPKSILEALSIKVVGKATEDIKDEVFKITINNEEIIIAAVPYLRDGDIRKAVTGESFDELIDKYKKALVNHYKLCAEACKLININNAPTIAMGHLFAIGGSISDSEQNIYVGSLGHIGANDFPEYYNYIALGHLHRPQIVGDKKNIRYSGSPNILSFSETNYNKKVILISTKKNTIKNIEEITIPTFRKFYTLKGTIDQCIEQFSNITSNSYQLTPWVEIILDEKNTINTDKIKVSSEKYTFEILKISLKNQRKQKGIEELLDSTTSIKELQPTEVFKLKCKEMEYDLKNTPKIWDAFNEILQTVKNQ